MNKVKLCFQDGGHTKLLFGIIETEDSNFIMLIAEDGRRFRIGKPSIVFIKELEDDKNVRS